MSYDKTEMNAFVQSLYDAKMAEGKRGHYETMFHVVHKAIERATPAALPVGELTTDIPHSLAGFRGAFESEHGRKPTEQEIWNAAIRSWRDLQPSTALMYSLDADQQGIRARVVQAVFGALAFGTRNENKPPQGHWLNEIWDTARAEREGAVDRGLVTPGGGHPFDHNGINAAARSQPVREPLYPEDCHARGLCMRNQPGHICGCNIAATGITKKGAQ